MEYEELKTCYRLAMKVCDPVEYQYRQQNLLHALAKYMIEIHEYCEEEEGV